MRKQVIQRTPPGDEQWFDLEKLVRVEFSSEDQAHPVDRALDGSGAGWRALGPGEQVIRLLFDEPTRVARVQVQFDEDSAARTQEFVLRWSSDGGHSYHDIVRQQYTFSPPGTTRQVERYTVDVDRMTTLELRVIPDIRGGAAVASLSRLQVA